MTVDMTLHGNGCPVEDHRPGAHCPSLRYDACRRFSRRYCPVKKSRLAQPLLAARPPRHHSANSRETLAPMGRSAGDVGSLQTAALLLAKNRLQARSARLERTCYIERAMLEIAADPAAILDRSAYRWRRWHRAERNPGNPSCLLPGLNYTQKEFFASICNDYRLILAIAGKLSSESSGASRMLVNTRVSAELGATLQWTLRF